MFDFLSGTPIVGDLLGSGMEHASAKALQNDSQAHDAHMFGMSAGHDKDMFNLQKMFSINQFGRESNFAKDMAKVQYDRQLDSIRKSPGLQMKGLKEAGLNPVLAATGGFRSAAGSPMPVPRAGAQASAKPTGARGSGQHAAKISKMDLAHSARQTKLINEQAELIKAQKEKTQEETKYVGQKTDIAEPVAKLMQALVGLMELAKLDKQSANKTLDWLFNTAKFDISKPMTEEQAAEMLKEIYKRHPTLPGVKNKDRKIFGGGFK